MEHHMKNKLKKQLNGKKASEVFNEYAAPVLEIYLQDSREANIEEIEQVLQMPWLIWNAMVIKEDPNNKLDYLASIKLLLKDAPLEIKKLIEFMCERKKTLFKQYNYLLGEYKLLRDPRTN